MQQERRAVSLDLDGVLFPRPIPIQGGALLAYIQPWSYNKPFVPKHAPITASDREPQIHLFSEWERNEVKRHLNRLVKPEVAEMVKSSNADAIFGNTRIAAVHLGGEIR